MLRGPSVAKVIFTCSAGICCAVSLDFNPPKFARNTVTLPSTRAICVETNGGASICTAGLKPESSRISLIADLLNLSNGVSIHFPAAGSTCDVHKLRTRTLELLHWIFLAQRSRVIVLASLSSGYQSFASGSVRAKEIQLLLAEAAGVRKNQHVAVKALQGSWSHDLKLQVGLQQKHQEAAVGLDEFVREVVPRLGREVNSNRLHRLPWEEKVLLMLLDPAEDQLARLDVVRSRHYVPLRVPCVRAGHELGHCQILHCLAGRNLLLLLPRVTQHPAWFIAGEGAERVHSNQVLKPCQRRASGRHPAR